MSKGEKRRQKRANRRQRKTVTAGPNPPTKGTSGRSRHLEAINEAQRRTRRERELTMPELAATLRQVPELRALIHAVNVGLDAGSGTVGAVATGHNRNAVLIDLDERNRDLAYDRVGPFLWEEAELGDTPV